MRFQEIESTKLIFNVPRDPIALPFTPPATRKLSPNQKKNTLRRPYTYHRSHLDTCTKRCMTKMYPEQMFLKMFLEKKKSKMFLENN